MFDGNIWNVWTFADGGLALELRGQSSAEAAGQKQFCRRTLDGDIGLYMLAL